jgi:hypothetical protein
MALVLSATSAPAATKRAKKDTTSKRRTAVTKKVKPPKKGKKAPVVEEEVAPAAPMEAFGTSEPEEASDAPAQATPAPSVKPNLTPAPRTDAPALSTTTPAPNAAPAAAVAPAAAWVGSVAVLAVAREPGSAEMAAQLQGELGRLLASHSDVQLVDLGQSFPPPAPASLVEGDKLFEEAKSLYDNLDPESAVPKFQAAANFYAEHPAELNPDMLARVYIFLGAAQLLNNDKDGAHVAFLRALAAEPTATPDVNSFGGDVQSAFSAAQEEHQKKAQGTLTVESLPAGAKVTVHGKEVGVTPLKDLALPAGRHAVVVTHPGYTPHAVFQEISSTQPATVKTELEPAPGLAPVLDAARMASTEKAFEAGTMPPEAGAIADRLGARYVVLAAVQRDRKGRARAELQAWDTRTQARLRGVTIIPGSKDRDEGALAASERVHQFVTGALAPSNPGFAMPALMKKPWFWAAVGGAALVTTGVVVYASQDRAPGLGPISGTPGLGF